MKKTVISLTVALALVLSVVPAIAGDTFGALSSMPAGEQTLLTPLSDEQLATIEGAAFKKHDRHGKKCCGDVGVNIADIDQTNLNIGGFAYQSNLAVVSQSNR
jgi:hypothetical protein